MKIATLHLILLLTGCVTHNLVASYSVQYPIKFVDDSGKPITKIASSCTQQFISGNEVVYESDVDSSVGTNDAITGGLILTVFFPKVGSSTTSIGALVVSRSKPPRYLCTFTYFSKEVYRVDLSEIRRHSVVNIKVPE
jgi:hypothetical protein